MTRSTRSWYRQLHWQIILGLILGLAFGIFAAAIGWGQFVADWIAPFGTIFLNLLLLIAVPLVIASLVTGVANLSDVRSLSRIGGKTIAIYLATTTVAIVIGLLIVNLVRPGHAVPEERRAQLQEAYEADAVAREQAAEAARERGPLQFLVDIVPSNFIASAGDNRNMLQIVFVALFLGIGLVLAPADKVKPVHAFFDGLTHVIIRMIDVVMYVAPLGVFALIANTITTLAGDDIRQVWELLMALLWYCGAVVLGLFIHIVVTYTALLKIFTRMPLSTFATGIFPAQIVAFSTSSSAATLPVTLERCEEALGVSEEISSFVLPLGATINMDGTALYQAISAVFIAQTVGMGLGLTEQLAIVLTALLASVGTAAVPGAGVIMLVIILQAVGVPTAGIALILGVDRILDMLRTVTNITGDAAVASAVAATEGQLNPPDVVSI